MEKIVLRHFLGIEYPVIYRLSVGLSIRQK